MHQNVSAYGYMQDSVFSWFKCLEVAYRSVVHCGPCTVVVMYGLSSLVSNLIIVIMFPALIHTALTNLWVEEDLRPQEALVANVDGELLLADGVDARVLFDPLGAICVVLAELLNEVRADVAKPLLNKQNNTEQLFRGRH